MDTRASSCQYFPVVLSGGYIGYYFDPLSIMLHPIPTKLTLDGFSTESNNVLSSVDKAFIRSLHLDFRLLHMGLTAGGCVGLSAGGLVFVSLVTHCDLCRSLLVTFFPVLIESRNHSSSRLWRSDSAMWSVAKSQFST